MKSIHSRRCREPRSRRKNYLTSFQNAAFRRQATKVKQRRKSSTHTPTRMRVFWAGSAIYCR
jgi:hypothetical protein